MSIEEKIKELKIKLPDPKDPVGAYVASKIVGKLVRKYVRNMDTSVFNEK